MKRTWAALCFAAITATATSACSRTVQVRTAPTTAEATLHFTNNLSQAVNVYIVQGGTETFVSQVAANTTENLPVRGVPQGSQVLLRAVTIDGKSQFDTQNPITLTSSYTWRVP